MLFLAVMFTHASQLYSYVLDQSWYMSVSCISTKITEMMVLLCPITLNMAAPQARTHFPRLFPNHFQFPRLFQVYHVGGHHETSSLLTASAETALTLCAVFMSTCTSSMIKGTSDQHHRHHSGPKRAGTHSSLSLPSPPCSDLQSSQSSGEQRKRVAASCLAKPSCYTWPARWYLCCPAWQLVDCVDCASAFDICEIKNYFTLL